MSTQTQKDDDLIILTDDTQADEFNFDFNVSSDTQDKEVISFEITEEKEKTLDKDDTFSFEFIDTPTSSSIDESAEKVLPKEQEETDFGFDLLNTSSQESSENDVIQDPVPAQDLSFFDDSQDDDENLVELKPTETIEPKAQLLSNDSIVSNPPTSQVLDRNDILSEAILKLEQRKDVIVDEKSQTSGHITELEEQIKKLQNQVKGLKEDMNKLENEEKGILSDIASIEKIRDFQTETQSKVKKASETKIK